MLDIYFPVNTIYGTFDSTFDPNTAWGGTWVKITDGRVLVPSTTPNITGGSSTSGSTTLTAAQSGVPAHSHNLAILGYTEGSSNTRYTVGWGYTRVHTLTTSNNTAQNASSGHTHPNINPLNRSYCLWYRTA